MRAREEGLVASLLLELGGDSPGKEVDDYIAQVAILVRVPGAVEEVEGAAHADRQVLQQGDQSTLREEVRNVQQHHRGAMPAGMTRVPAALLPATVCCSLPTPGLECWLLT